MEGFAGNIFVILFPLVVIFGLALSITREGKYQKVITVSLTGICVLFLLVVFVGIPLVYYLLALGLFLAGTVWYAVATPALSLPERILIACMGIACHGRYVLLFLTESGRYTPFFMAAQIMCLLLFVYVLAQRKFSPPREMGFLFIWTMFIILDLAAFALKQID